eukprot:g2682.t1
MNNVGGNRVARIAFSPTQLPIDEKKKAKKEKRKRKKERQKAKRKERKERKEKNLTSLVDSLSNLNFSDSDSSSFNLAKLAERINSGHIRKVVWLSGAGISTSAGIPDFRTPGSGLYDSLQKYNLPKPSAVFNLNFFRSNPIPFFRLCKDLLPGRYKPTKTHCFIRLLYEKNILHRCWTQNIDGLERAVGVPEEKLVEAHGTFASCHCTNCGASYPLEKMKIAIDRIYNEILWKKDTKPPLCETCSVGVPKPDITFFGERLPRRFTSLQSDFDKADLIIVAGTSLQVLPFCTLPDLARKQTPRLLINRELVGPWLGKRRRGKDIAEIGNCDDVCEKMVNLLGWKNEFQALSFTS